MSELTEATRLALLEERVKQLRASEAELERKVAALEALDKNRMRWAIGSLGAVVMALGTYIWTFKVDGK
tara:strand:- start:188 stop:394 length:207 start_codon:yes stop_codon:yes gene_type:complete